MESEHIRDRLCGLQERVRVAFQVIHNVAKDDARHACRCNAVRRCGAAKISLVHGDTFANIARPIERGPRDLNCRSMKTMEQP